MMVDIPYLTWYVRNDGNIWAEWYINIYRGHCEWENLRRTKVGQGHNLYNIRFEVPMREESKHLVSKISCELWTLHKLSSSTLL